MCAYIYIHTCNSDRVLANTAPSDCTQAETPATILKQEASPFSGCICPPNFHQSQLVVSKSILWTNNVKYTMEYQPFI